MWKARSDSPHPTRAISRYTDGAGRPLITPRRGRNKEVAGKYYEFGTKGPIPLLRPRPNVPWPEEEPTLDERVEWTRAERYFDGREGLSLLARLTINNKKRRRCLKPRPAPVIWERRAAEEAEARKLEALAKIKKFKGGTQSYSEPTKPKECNTIAVVTGETPRRGGNRGDGSRRDRSLTPMPGRERCEEPPATGAHPPRRAEDEGEEVKPPATGARDNAGPVHGAGRGGRVASPSPTPGELQLAARLRAERRAAAVAAITLRPSERATHGSRWPGSAKKTKKVFIPHGKFFHAHAAVYGVVEDDLPNQYRKTVLFKGLCRFCGAKAVPGKHTNKRTCPTHVEFDAEQTRLGRTKKIIEEFPWCIYPGCITPDSHMVAVCPTMHRLCRSVGCDRRGHAGGECARTTDELDKQEKIFNEYSRLGVYTSRGAASGWGFWGPVVVCAALRYCRAGTSKAFVPWAVDGAEYEALSVAEVVAKILETLWM